MNETADWQNLSQMHRTVADRYGTNPALRFRSNGLFRDVTWADYRRQADRAALGLIQLGLEPGDRVGMFSENRPEWLIADIALLAAGGVNVPVHSSTSAQQAAYQFSHSETRFVFVSNQAQADKIFQAEDDIPSLEGMITFDSIQIPRTRLRVSTWPALLHSSEFSKSHVDRVRERESMRSRHDLATIMYTSGTTGNPKGVMLSHGNLISNAVATIDVGQIGPKDILMSWLPYSHIYARTCDHYQTILAGSTVALAQSAESLVDDLKYVQPTWMTAVPRFYEKIWSLVEKEPRETRRRVLGDIFGPRLRFLCSGGAPLPKHVCEGFHDSGIILVEGYGLTECSPVISFNRIDDFRIGTVGQGVRGTKIRIAADGEIQVQSESVMLGYWKNETATAESLVDGWLNTGDIGAVDERGFLRITDRKKELIVLSNGKKVMPTEIERQLIADPSIDQAVVFGDGRPFLTAILVPCASELADASQARSEALGKDFLGCSQVCERLQQRVDLALNQTCPWEHVRKVLVLSRPLSIDEGELTPTMKVRRRAIAQKFEKEIASLYECR